MSTVVLKKEPKWYTTLGMLFVSFLLIANVIAGKPVEFGHIIIPASILVYPLTYIIAVAVTEVYGFSHARQIIWLAMACNILMAIFYQAAIALPPIDGWEHQAAYMQVLGSSTRIVAASIVSFLVGEMFNAYIVAKMKIAQQGKRFWLRAVLGMSLSEAINSTIFLTGAFYGIMSNEQIFKIGVCYYSFKMGYAVIAIPLLSLFVKTLKRVEGIDVYESV